MNRLSSNIFRAAAMLLALPLLGLSAAVQVNGICVDGNCITPAPLLYGIGNSQTGTTFSSTTVSADTYSVSTAYNVGVGESGGTFANFFPTVTYVGGGLSTSNDTITVDLLASIFDAEAANWDGTYTENVPFTIAPGSTASGQLFVDGQGVGLVGPFGEGNFNETISKTLIGVDGSTLNFDFQYIFNFSEGFAPGASDSSPAAEPAEIIPAAVSLAGFALVALRRRKRGDGKIIL